MNDAQPASHWVTRFLPGAAPNGEILDVACGKGRHLRLAHSRGYAVVGIDRDLSDVTDLSKQPEVEFIAADLEGGAPFPVAGRKFAGVIVTNYLWRPILPAIVDCVADDGLLIYETFAAGNERYGRPSHPDHLLRPGELITAVHPRLIPVAFEHVTLRDPARVVQRIAAIGPNHRWRNSPPSIESS